MAATAAEHIAGCADCQADRQFHALVSRYFQYLGIRDQAESLRILEEGFTGLGTLQCHEPVERENLTPLGKVVEHATTGCHRILGGAGRSPASRPGGSGG